MSGTSEQAQNVGNNLTIYTLQTEGAQTSYSAEWGVSDVNEMTLTLDFSASENTQVLEPAGTSGMAVAVPLQGGTKSFCCKVGPVDATKSSSVQMGLQMQQTAGTPNPPPAAGGASAPSADGGGGGGGGGSTFDAASFEFSAGANKKEISPKVSLLKEPSDGGYVFGVENGKAKAIEVTIDFTGSVNLKETYPEDTAPAAKVSSRIEPGTTAVLARVAPAGPGQCQIRSGMHVEEVSKAAKPGKFGANPKGASVTKSKPVSESTKEYAGANMQATSKNFGVEAPAPALPVPAAATPASDDPAAPPPVPALPQGTVAAAADAAGSGKVAVCIDSQSGETPGELACVAGDELYVQSDSRDGKTMCINARTGELGDVLDVNHADPKSMEGRMALASSAHAQETNQETGMLNETRGDEKRMWKKPGSLIQGAGAKHEGKWKAAAPVFDDSVNRLANQHAVDYLHGAQKGADQYVPAVGDVHAMAAQGNAGEAALPLATGYLKTAEEASGARGAGFGMDAELAAQRAEQYQQGAGSPTDQARAWIEALTGEAFSQPDDFHASLKDGVLLCKTINAIVPGTIPAKAINSSKMPFKQMENISNFLKAARTTIGVPEYDLFETVDLFEAKDMALVVRGIHSLGSTVQDRIPSFAGPHLGVTKSKKNERVWSEEERRRNAAEHGGMTKLAAGSHGIMERGKIDKSNEIHFGAAQSGTGSSEATAVNQGSAGVMERGEIDTSNDITFGDQK